MPITMSLRRWAGAVLVLLAAALAVPAPIAAQGDLLIAPTRLVLDGRRGGEIILSNIGNREATYRVDLELRRMTAEGELVAVEDASANVTEQAALEMVRYAPRRVTLPPDQPQAIRISARPGADLPDGEYRVHLSFAALPRVQALAPPSEHAQAGGFTINLVPIYGITMPVIIRKGELEVTAGLANPRVETGGEGAVFRVDITRSGTASIYGDLLVYRQGAGEPVLVARGIGVYTEIESRHSAFGLSPEQAAAMHGPVRIELREPLQSGGALITALDAVLQ